MITKICTKCKKELPATLKYFSIQSNMKRLRSQCKECSNKYSKKYRLKNKEKLQEYNKQYAEKNKEKIKRYNKAKYRRNPEYYKELNLQRNFKLIIDQYNKLLEDQNSKCAICGRDNNVKKALAVDHNHKTGKIRGLLCHNCNIGLGVFNDNPLILIKVVKYLRDD